MDEVLLAFGAAPDRARPAARAAAGPRSSSSARRTEPKEGLSLFSFALRRSCSAAGVVARRDAPPDALFDDGTVPLLACRDVITLDDVQAAARRIDGVAHRTPVITGRSLDEATGADRVC